MKKSILIIFFSSVLIFCIWLIKNSQSSRNFDHVLKQELHLQSTPMIDDLEQQAESLLNSIHTPYEMIRKRNDSLDEFYTRFKSPDQQKSLRVKMTTASKPIDFHGRVVDQFGNGVPNVLIGCKTFRIARLDSGSIEIGNYIFSVKTDSNGDFSITGFNAINLSVEKLEKDGYQAVDEELFKSTYYTAPNEPTYTDSTPGTFHMWKLIGGEEPLIQNMQRCELFNDGTPKIINIGNRREDWGAIHIAVKIDTDSYSSDGKNWDWSFTIEVPEGGVLLTESPMPYLAPQDGYMPKIQVRMESKDPDWERSKTLTAYVVSGNPKRYSRVVFDVNTATGYGVDLKGRNIVSSNYRMDTNPSGSRFLVPKSGDR